MKGVVAGIIFAMGLLCFLFRPIIGYFKDIPLGPINVWERDPTQAKRNDEANVAAQNRLWERLRYLWVVGIVCFVAGALVLAI